MPFDPHVHANEGALADRVTAPRTADVSSALVITESIAVIIQVRGRLIV
jgi:hypothetical protein